MWNFPFNNTAWAKYLNKPEPAEGAAQPAEASCCQAQSQVADDDVLALAGAVNGRVGAEVVCPAFVLAPRGVREEVQRPAKSFKSPQG